MEKTITQIYTELKAAAIDSGFVNDVILAKSELDVMSRVEDLDKRILFVVVQSATIYTEADAMTFTLSVMDKTQFDDDAYLMSINDGVGLLKHISNKMNYSGENSVAFGDIDIGSEATNEEIMTAVTCDITFSLVYLPNITA